MTIELFNDYYNIFYFSMDSVNGGRVRYGRSGLKCIDSFGDRVFFGKSFITKIHNEKQAAVDISIK
jgi:hypothetical protein